MVIEPDATLLTRNFWMSVNWVLWLVSPVWVAVRSDPITSHKSKKKKQKRSVTNAQIVDQNFIQHESSNNVDTNVSISNHEIIKK